jgi:uncharacterized pyridoxamine 5'-phosphate oxidase family protein
MMDLDRLQALLDQSVNQAGPHLRRTFELPEHSLSAAQLARYWGRERQFALATVTARGEPRVGPVQVLLQHGRLYVPTAVDAARVQHVTYRPAVSLTHWVSDVVAIIGHGRAVLVPPDSTEFDRLATAYPGQWWHDLRRAGHGAFLLIDLAALYTWARDPGAFPPD